MRESTKKFYVLDALRGVAAIAVMLGHWSQDALPTVPWLSGGYLAVDLFFVLSGVVVAHAYEDRLARGWPVSRFLIARVIRLGPLYYLGAALGVVAALVALGNGSLHLWQFKLIAIDGSLSAAVLPKAWSDGLAYPLNAPSWSLFFELLINVAYGFGGYRLSTRALTLVAGAGLAGMIAGGWYYRELHVGMSLGALGIHWWVGLARVCFSFPLGILVYRYWRSARPGPSKVWPSVVLLAFVALVLLNTISSPVALSGSLLTIVVAWPLLVYLGMNVQATGLLDRFGRKAGDLSYAIYTIHSPILLIAVAISTLTGASVVLLCSVAVLVTFPVSALAVRAFDVPVRRALSRLAVMPVAAVEITPAQS